MIFGFFFLFFFFRWFLFFFIVFSIPYSYILFRRYRSAVLCFIFYETIFITYLLPQTLVHAGCPAIDKIDKIGFATSSSTASMVAPLYTTASGLLFHAGKILVITVGLPARGKTHISRALERYLRWMGVKTQVVSLGDYRRKTIGGAQQLPPDYFTLGMIFSLTHTLSLTHSISPVLYLAIVMVSSSIRNYRREKSRNDRFAQENF